MRDRIAEKFMSARKAQRTLFMPYLTAGYPHPRETVDLLLTLEKSGADAVELGVPFTDPLADGTTIQKANEIALTAGITFSGCLHLVKEARSQGLSIPVLLMGYANPFIAYGEEKAISDAADAGADGFIVVDLPPEESKDFVRICKQKNMSFVPLISPTTTNERIEYISRIADTFLYCVSVTGTTGKRETLPPDLKAFIQRIKKQTDLPLAVGFGISTQSHVAQVGKIADAVVMGSAIISVIDAAGGVNAAQHIREFVSHITAHDDSQ